jgi:kexin
LPRPRAAARSGRFRCLLLAASALLFAGCGGGEDASAPTLSAGPGCELSYSLTQSPILTGADPLLRKQWHLQNTGQNGGLEGEDLRALPAWTLTRGAGVRVAVVDDAVELVHPDLYPNVVAEASYSYRSGNRGSVWPLPCTAAIDDHGTAVAGIVLARDDNAIGGAGVAPRASLVAFDALASSLDVDIADALGRDGQLNAIYQNSWGSPDTGQLQRAEPSFAAMVARGIATGRDGRGSIYVFPAGNGGCYANDDAGQCQVDNANFDGYVNQRGVIAVCAVDDTGVSPWYAEPGANVLVCAPTSGDIPNVVTTALRGGYRDFSGTSASTPMVSGVVALMLSVNPRLSWRDVRLILAETARRNDPADPDWREGPGGLHVHPRYGYGVVDAAAAVERAKRWISVGDSATLRTCEIPERVPELAIPDRPAFGEPIEISDTVSVTGCGITRIELVELTTTIAHGFSGDLRIRLSSPAGHVSELANARFCVDRTGTDAKGAACGDYDHWTFGSVRHIGEAANGQWRLSIADMLTVDTGRLQRWSLRIHGR